MRFLPLLGYVYIEVAQAMSDIVDLFELDRFTDSIPP